MKLSRWYFGAAVAGLLVAPFLMQTTYSLTLLNTALINAITVIGLHLIYGLGGILSAAQMAFVGMGAYTSAILTVRLGMPFAVGLVAAGAVAAATGLLVGVPTLRLRTHYLTMVTVAVGVVLVVLINNLEGLTGGPSGMRLIPPASFGPLVLESPRQHYYLVLLLLAAAVAGAIALRHSRLGRGLVATRDNDLAAMTMGVNITRLKVMAFGLSALYAGVAGSLYAHLVRYISPDTFGLPAMLQILAMLLIGGRRSVPGAAVGAVLLTYLPEWLRFMKEWYPTLYGLGLLLILAFLPDGIAGLLDLAGRRRTPSLERSLPATGGEAQ